MVAPARGATMLKKQIIPIVRAFQSALPRGERQQIGGSPDEDRNISIHAPARGATIQLHLTQCCSVFQSTLPRGERHHAGFAAFYVGISIHAPTRGATISKRVSSPSLRISIHAPTRGATTGSKVCRKVFVISIHAPTRGATVKVEMVTYFDEFQSTLPRGERRKWLIKTGWTIISIHAPTRGATRTVESNPQAEHISIHAPTRGAT